MNRRRRNVKTLSVRAPLSCKEAIELYLQEQERGMSRCRFSRWGRFGDLWLRAVCWSCLCDGRRGASASGDLVCAEGICDASEILLSVGERGRPAARSSPATRLRAAMRRGAVKVREGRLCFRVRSAKCLQTCTIDSIPGGRQHRVRRLLRHACSNDDGSGYLGTLREARNFEVVRRTLAAEGFFLWVYESFSAEALSCGEMQGRWRLGAVSGECVGSMVWLREESHVVRLVFRPGFRHKELGWHASGEVAPWFRYVVGAPKRGDGGGEQGSGQRKRPRMSGAAGAPLTAEALRSMSVREMEVACRLPLPDPQKRKVQALRYEGGKRVRLTPDELRRRLAEAHNLSLDEDRTRVLSPLEEYVTWVRDHQRVPRQHRPGSEDLMAQLRKRWKGREDELEEEHRQELEAVEEQYEEEAFVRRYMAWVAEHKRLPREVGRKSRGLEDADAEDALALWRRRWKGREDELDLSGE